MLKAEQNQINLSLNPTYFCNFRCNFCYLTEQQLSSTTLLEPKRLDAMLSEITASGKNLGRVDLYGGEVLLLPDSYLNELKSVMHGRGISDIEIITNLSSFKKSIIEDTDFGLSVSYDFEHRQQHEHVLKNILKIERPFTILTLGIPQIVQSDPTPMIEQINILANCEQWEIKPYSPNQANQLDVKYTQFEDFVRKIIEYPNKRFEFLNEIALRMAMFGDANPYSDDHVYITPSGKFGVLEFDKSDNEFFLELDSFEKYIDWTLDEKARVFSNAYCGSCDYFGRCVSEHLREVTSIENSCNGFYKLINWYEKK